MATMSSAKEKYARKTGPGSPAVSKYNAAKARMGGNWRRGMAEFLGAPVNPAVAASYDAGISAANYTGGNPDKWERNLRAAMT